MNQIKSGFSFDVQFTKAKGTKREIEGYASTSSKDRDGEYFPKELLEKASQEYIKMGTLLFDHGNDPVYGRRTVGMLYEAKVDDEGRMYVKGRVSDDYIWEKIELGELKAFSIGGRASWEMKEVKGEIIGVATSLEIFEVSIVSVPANPEALFSIAKSLEKSFLDAKDNLGDKKQYNVNITTNEEEHMEEMLKNIQTKIESLVGKDSKVEELEKSISSLNTEKETLETQKAELEAKVEELTKSLDDERANQETLKAKMDELDKKLTEVISTKKKGKTDEEIEDKKEEEIDTEEVAEEVEKAYNVIFGK